jgi:phosphoglycolate phosphatase/putative hydrolase of the HAD superfamily
MKVYRRPEKIKALIFDMDLTLYSNAEYGKTQIDNLVAIAGQKRGWSLAEANRKIEAERQSWAFSHGGKKPSLSNIILSWGFTMEDNIIWREKAYEPEKFLKKDEAQRKTILALSCYALGIITNNPVSIAKRTLVCLGVEDCFSALVGLDTCMIPKPHEVPFTRIIGLLNDSRKNSPGTEQITPETCISIGDRYEIDLEIPLEMGMGAILVDGVEDVYALRGLL